MDWVLFILPGVLVMVGLALVLATRYDYRVQSDSARARADEERLASRLNARHQAQSRQQALWQNMTPLVLEDAFDRFASLDVEHDAELTNQVDTAFDEFMRATHDSPRETDDAHDTKLHDASSN